MDSIQVKNHLVHSPFFFGLVYLSTGTVPQSHVRISPLGHRLLHSSHRMALVRDQHEAERPFADVLRVEERNVGVRPGLPPPRFDDRRRRLVLTRKERGKIGLFRRPFATSPTQMLRSVILLQRKWRSVLARRSALDVALRDVQEEFRRVQILYHIDADSPSDWEHVETRYALYVKMSERYLRWGPKGSMDAELDYPSE